jgi:catechol 2,3-dioxygenase-like lactoylglutathione lyase family enzyme
VPPPTIDEFVLADDPERWAQLGFAIAGGCCELGDVRLRFLDDAGVRGIVGWSLRDIASTELDGLPTTRSQRPPPEGTGDAEATSSAHPNGALAIDHVVAMSPALDRSVAALRAAGLQLRRIREEPTPAGAPRQAFFRLGSEILELIQEPRDVVERAGGPDGPARFWGFALRARDLERTVALLGEHAGTIRPAIQPGRRIATVRRSAGVATALAFMSDGAGRAET